MKLNYIFIILLYNVIMLLYCMWLICSSLCIEVHLPFDNGQEEDGEGQSSVEGQNEDKLIPVNNNFDTGQPFVNNSELSPQHEDHEEEAPIEKQPTPEVHEVQNLTIMKVLTCESDDVIRQSSTHNYAESMQNNKKKRGRKKKSVSSDTKRLRTDRYIK